MRAVGTLIDNDLTLAVAVLDFARPFDDQRATQPCQRRIVEMAFNHIADKCCLAITVGARLVKLTATINRAIAVVISSTFKQPLTSHSATLLLTLTLRALITRLFDLSRLDDPFRKMRSSNAASRRAQVQWRLIAVAIDTQCILMTSHHPLMSHKYSGKRHKLEINCAGIRLGNYAWPEVVTAVISINAILRVKRDFTGFTGAYCSVHRLSVFLVFCYFIPNLPVKI